MCGAVCYITQVSGLVVCLSKTSKPPLGEQLQDDYDPSGANLQTQISFQHLKSSLQVSQRFKAIHSDLGNVERRHQQDKLYSLASRKNPYALMQELGSGHHTYMAKAVAYVAICPNVQVIRTECPNCTQEIPVVVNRMQFANLITRILLDRPTMVPCSQVMPIMWLLHDEWYCAMPKMVSVPHPVI